MKNYLKLSVFLFTLLMVVANLKKVSIKSTFPSNLTFISTSNALFGLKSQNSCREFHCTCLLRSRKLVEQDTINLALFNKNLQRIPGNFTVLVSCHQQTSTLRGQKSYSIYSKFSLDLSELTLSFQNPQEVS